jgi:hypothetical protein
MFSVLQVHSFCWSVKLRHCLLHIANTSMLEMVGGYPLGIPASGCGWPLFRKLLAGIRVSFQLSRYLYLASRVLHPPSLSIDPRIAQKYLSPCLY